MNPSWSDELKRRYLRGESCQFVLHGNVHDLVLHDGKLHDLVDYLGTMLAASKDVVLEYNLSSGVRFLKKDAQIEGLEDLFIPRSPDKVLPALEKLLLTTNRVAVIISYAEMIAPAADVSFSTEGDRQSVIALHRWSLSPILEKSDNLVVLLTENLSELHGKLVGNPRTVALNIGMPDEDARAAVIAHVTPASDAAWRKRLAEVTAGLKAVQLKALLEPHGDMPDDPAALAAREKYIATLLANATNATARAKKLAQLTAGMNNDEIRDLVAPGASAKADANDEHEQLLRLIYKRKREIIERECFGLIEFVESHHDFSVVGGIEEVKKELLTIAQNMRDGRRSRCPMGLLFTGPMGTGKTFVAEAFVRETGLTAVKLGNFRSKWVGATEGNLDRVLSVIRAIGQIIVIIDEGDRAFGSQDGEGDGGTSSRVIARIKEFMSDTSNRGRVMFILMTNRPDKLDIDIKRAGRLDKKIPFVYPQEPVEVEAVLGALLRKHRITHTIKLPDATVSTPLVGYSNAEIEAVVLLANEYAGDKPMELTHLTQALRDYLPSRDEAMLEFMELIAVFEASNRKMLPKKYAEMSNDALQARLNELRLTVGSRR